MTSRESALRKMNRLPAHSLVHELNVLCIFIAKASHALFTATSLVFQPSTDKRKKDLFNSERKEMVKAGEAMFKQNLKWGSVFLRNASRNDDSYYVRPMFELVWPPFIGPLYFFI